MRSAALATVVGLGGVLGGVLAEWNVAACRWLLDQPVSNSGRLKTLLRQVAEEYSWNWQIDLVPDPDSVLIRSTEIVATADSRVLDHVERWFNLARLAIVERVPDAWIVELGRSA